MPCHLPGPTLLPACMLQSMFLRGLFCSVMRMHGLNENQKVGGQVDATNALGELQVARD